MQKDRTATLGSHDLATWLKVVREDDRCMDPILAKFIQDNDIGKHTRGDSWQPSDDTTNDDQIHFRDDTTICFAASQSSPFAQHAPQSAFWSQPSDTMAEQNTQYSDRTLSRTVPPHLRSVDASRQNQRREEKTRHVGAATTRSLDSQTPDWSKANETVPPAAVESTRATLLTPPATRASEPPVASDVHEGPIASKASPTEQQNTGLSSMPLLAGEQQTTPQTLISTNLRSSGDRLVSSRSAAINEPTVKIIDWATKQHEKNSSRSSPDQSLAPVVHSTTSSSHKHKSTVSSASSNYVAKLLNVKKSVRGKTNKGKQADRTKQPKSKQTAAARPSASKWVKSREIPKGPDPRKVKLGLDLGSRYSGWLTNPDEVKSKDINDKKALGVQPVEDWDGRPAFRDEKLSSTIDAWATRIARELRPYDTLIDLTEYTKAWRKAVRQDTSSKTFPAKLLRPIVPSYWIPTKIDGASPELYWKVWKCNKSPTTVDEHDLRDVMPWWKEFPPYDSPFEQHYEQPVVKGIDPDETNEQRTARINDYGSDKAVERLRAEHLRRMAALHRAQADTTDGPLEQPGVGHLSNKLRVLNSKTAPQLTIRSANREDMPQLCTIYNHYINFSVAVDELQPITEQVITERWRKALLAGLPMLVACEKAHIVKDRRKGSRGAEIVVPDKVVGFAFVSDHPYRKAVYRHTKRLRFFTHNQYYMQGIASRLVDSLLKLIDKNHVEQTDLPAEPSVDPYGPKPEIYSLIVEFLFDSEDTAKFKWITKWLRKAYDFSKPAVVHHVARKHNKLLNLATFQKDVNAEDQPVTVIEDEGW